MSDIETPKVWIGCLGCYNAGTLVGAWVDALEAETFTVDSVTALLSKPDSGYSPDALAEHLGTWHPAAAPHEELWVMDHEGFAGLLTGECSPSTAQELAELLEKLEDREREAYGPYLSNTGDPAGEDSLGAFRDAFLGKWDSERAYAEDYYAETTPEDAPDPPWPHNHIDWDGATRELFEDRWSENTHGGVFVYYAR